MKIVTAAEMQRIDQSTIADFGIAGRVLMERAGQAVVDSILERTEPSTPVLVIAGKGNNGGDGFVIARELVRLGRPARVLLLADPGDLRGDARANYDAALRFGVKFRIAREKFRIGMPEPGLIVDAILGTGLSSPLRGTLLQAVGAINRTWVPVVSVDIPTGVSSDTGMVLGNAVKATWTVAMGLPKRGHYLFPGAGFCGDLLVADIGFPSELLADDSFSVETTDERIIGSMLPARPRDGHKGTFGHVLVVAGSRYMKGAAVITALSAFRAGAGLVTVAAPASTLESFPHELMEAMTIPLPETPGGAIDPASCDEILDVAEKCDAVAVGPGLSREPEVEELVTTMVRRCRKAMVIDADGINALEGRIDVLAARKNRNLVLTPHPAEMGRLLGVKTLEVQADRFGTIRNAVARTGGKSFLLKGPYTLVAGPRKTIYLNTSGNDGLATAGSGDVLTGLLATFLAQGGVPSSAARLAAWIHGRAADVAAEKVPRRSLMARDVIRYVPGVIKAIDSDFDND